MDVGRHPNIELLTLAQLTGLKGRAGDFKATVHLESRRVIADRCTGCGDCAVACPQSTRNEWDLGLGSRKAIYRPYPQAVPSAYLIDIDTCLNSPDHFVCERCRKVCKVEAVEHDMKEEIRELEVGAVIVATGFDEFHPHVMKSYGYGVWQNVMTSLEFERLLNASGPTQGEIIRPSDRKEPRNLVFIQCVGARGEGGRPNCSRYCCMNAVKDALLIKQHQPDVESCTILYTDIRAFGKGFDGFVARAEAEDYIHFLRGRPSKLMELDNDDIEIFVEDTEERKQLRLQSDLVVLSCAGVPPPFSPELAKALRIDTNDIGFFTARYPDRPVETSRSGVFICGSAGGPQVIPDCVAQASAAAAQASILVKEHKLPEPEPVVPEPIDPAAEPRIGVFICHCGANIGRVIKIAELVEEAAKLPGVAYAGEELFACADSGQNSLKDLISEHKLNRVVVAACTPRTHEPVFRKACLEAGLNPYLLEMANIRDQCSWVHHKTRGEAWGKAVDLIRMAVARAAKLQPLQVTEVAVNKQVLVLGGGIAGLQAALDLHALDFEVKVVEAAGELGGQVRQLHGVFPGEGQPATDLVKRFEQSGIPLLLNTHLENITGYVGNFEVTLATGNGSVERTTLPAGAIIVAIGSQLFQPGANWGNDKPNVVTGAELEDILRAGDPDGLLKEGGQAVFVQCVGSRSQTEGYSGCSRYCCPTSVKQSLTLLEKGMHSTVLYRDMRMVGQGAEEYYRQARSQGVLFLRYDEEKPPVMQGKKKVDAVTLFETLLQREVKMNADLVVLATGMVNPEEHSEALRTLLKVPRGSDGFFMELHPELGPVETCIDGVFLCGTIQGPKDITDSLTQASAVAGKVAELLSRDQLYLEPVICEVDPERCRGCGECVQICEYHAPGLVERPDGQLVAEINRALCKGCGTCAVWCPTNAIRACHFTDDQINSMITALFEDYHVTKKE